jgi:hypothetical protein
MAGRNPPSDTQNPEGEWLLDLDSNQGPADWQADSEGMRKAVQARPQSPSCAKSRWLRHDYVTLDHALNRSGKPGAIQSAGLQGVCDFLVSGLQ